MTWTQLPPLVAILRGIRPEEVLQHCEVLIDAGFRAIEIPLNSPQALSSVQASMQAFGKDIWIGAGTVLHCAQVAQLAACAARFIVTPNTDPDIIAAASTHGLYSCIGCMSASEALSALKAGANALKLFPAGPLGPKYISALKAVLPSNIPLYAVGGITPQNIAAYLAAGCIGAGLGSDLYQAGQSPEQTWQRAQAFVAAYQAALPAETSR
ncbi:2-dehydro-3-deoxy-6-phosphogalactonate aldolase [Aquitalea sp.]|uniref:2-dehydro-3-deoxy-6-phosphogalactonate aldolase n=1 Tax=Aquitalea sp. TaxID=1872623 RepID=UPI00258E5F82|nr:2-dehydro-3-deoxy-6-phosphogalactonate aldolase [Aquitalea sp.]